jgi:hypothetical protein
MEKPEEIVQFYTIQTYPQHRVAWQCGYPE